MGKRILVIIAILVVISVAVYFVFFHNDKDVEEITQNERVRIESYLKELYGWRDMYEEALPEFQDINSANEDWVWDRVQQRLLKEDVAGDYLYTYAQIEKAQKRLFGTALKKTFPIDGTDFLVYDEKSDGYIPYGRGLGEEDEKFLISSIQKKKNNYTVEIIEYIVDHSRMYNEDVDYEEGYEIVLKNTQDDEIKTYWAEFHKEYIEDEEYASADTKNEEIKEYVLENQEKFNKKELVIDENEQTNHLYIRSVNKK